MRAWAALLTCMLGLSLAGCLAGSLPLEVRRITYWEKWGGFEGQAMRDVVDHFNQLERDKTVADPSYIPIEVDMVKVARLDQKLLVAVAGGNPPDVAGAWTWLVYSYSEKGALTDLTPFLEKSSIKQEQYLPVFWDMCQYDGRTWALPTTPASTALHWNKRLFREAGLNPDKGPETIEELEQMAEQLTVWEVTLADGSIERRRGWCKDVADDKKRLVQLGFLPAEPNWWSWAWGYYFGGQLWDGDSQMSADTSENIRGFNWVKKWSDNIGVSHLRKFQSGSGGFASPSNPFMCGRVAMQIQGVWMYNYIDKYAPGMDWSASPFPPPADRPDLKGTSNVEADILVIPRDSKDPEAAWTFIEFVSSQAGMEMLCLGHRKFSPLREVSPEFAANHPHPTIALFRDLATNANGFSTPKMGIWNEYKRELAASFDLVQAGQDAGPILQSVNTRIQASFERNQAIKALRSK